MTERTIDVSQIKLARVPHGGTRRLRTAIERELATLLAQAPLPLGRMRRLGALDTRDITKNGDTDAMARKIAERIHRELTK